MKIEQNKVITLAYTVREESASGPVVEVMDSHYPFQFLYGSGRLLPGFEAALRGRTTGEAFEFRLSPEEAYGPILEEHIVDVPRSAFVADESLLQAGQLVDLTDDLGRQHPGKVVGWTDETVTVDLNHTLAGKTLHFQGVVLNVREATREELARGSYIEKGGVRK